MMAPNYTAPRSAFAKQIGPGHNGHKASKEESVVKEKKGKRARG
jgi:predicted transcriptional regulator